MSGDTVDLGDSEATAWLSEHGAGYGLCQVYGNEPWHYELRLGAVDHGCPTPYADPTDDSKMQQWPALPADPAGQPEVSELPSWGCRGPDRTGGVPGVP
jgi:hypothetical protein